MAYFNPIYKTLKADDLCNVNTSGNMKLINTPDTFFIIWNLPAIITCPYATSHCKKSCYAIKAETAYPTVKPSRVKNFEMSRRADFADLMVETINRKISHYSRKGKKCVVRIHESGDFYNQTYTDSWLKVADYFKDNNNIVFMAYTKSLKFFVSRTIPENMVVRFSIWDDTKQADIELAKKLNLPTYSADIEAVVDDLVARGMAIKCRCEDCATCGECWSKNTKNIYCVIH